MGYLLVVLVAALFLALSVYAVSKLGVRRGQFLLGLFLWCLVSTIIFHIVGGWGMAALDLGAKLALVVDCVLFMVWKPTAQRA